MSLRTRRELFSDVGRGMLAAGLGASLAADLGFGSAWADDEPNRLTFGTLDPLVDLIRTTAPDKIIAVAVEKLRTGTELKELVAAAALANARAFGGEDYVGFHTLMALAPAYQMSLAEPNAALKPLAVLKVLHRNATRLKEVGPERETLKPVSAAKLASDSRGGEQLRAAARKADADAAEATFAAIAGAGKPVDALNELLIAVDDATEVHRVVLVSRAWDLLRFVGRARAHTMLRQSVRYCVNIEKNPNQAKYNAGVRELMPKLLDAHKLLAPFAREVRKADDAWVRKFADDVFAATADRAAEMVAAALAEGFAAEDIGAALSIGANELVLRDAGRPKAWAQPNKPEGSVHGDSTGVHCCDTVHAWRMLARAGDRRTQVTSLILAGYQVARDRAGRAEFAKWEPYPRAEHAKGVMSVAPDALLKELDGAIRERDQARAAALTARIGAEVPARAEEVFALLRGYAISEDGALHAEKYFATASDEYATARPAFRWRQLVALARVTASAHGYPAPGHKDARAALKG